jgi:hypothetical protein
MSPFLDRYWWLRLTPAALVLVASSALLTLMLQALARLPERDVIFSPTVVSGLFVALDALYLARFTYWSLQARTRKRARIAVLQGRIASDAVLSSSTIEAGPFFVLHTPRGGIRTTTTANRRFRWPARVLLAVILLLGFTPFVSDWYDRYVQSGQSLDQYLWGIVSSLGFLGPLPLAVLLPIVGVLLVIAPSPSSVISTIRGTPYGVTATSEGLTEITPLGRRWFVRWQDARLWEVSLGRHGGLNGHLFRLSSSTNAVAWTDAIIGVLGIEAANGPQSDEALARQQALLDLVAARTGLQPRTYVTGLKAREAHEVERRLRREAIITPLVLAFYMIGVAIAVVVAPFGPDLALNAAIAGAYSVAALITLSLSLYEVVRQRRQARPPRNEKEPYQGPAAPPDFSDSATYILSQGKPVFVRIAVLVASSLVLAAGIIGYIAFRQALSITTDFARTSINQMAWTVLLESALFFGGFVAIVMFVVFGMAGRMTFRADPEKVSVKTELLSISTASWQQIERVLIQTQRGRPVTYQAFGVRNRLLARWDVERWQPSRRTGSVTPDEFAVIVAQRSGAKVVIEEAAAE